MQRPTFFTFAIGLAAILMTGNLRAADGPSPAELKMRDNLRTTMLELRKSEADKAALQAAQTENETKLKEATAKVEAMIKERSADRDAAEKMINSLKTRQAEQGMEIAKLKEALEKWQASQKEAADLAAKKEGERAKLANEKIILQRQVADQQTKNDAMFKLGNEILVRYEKFGLGDALTSREPFVGITRIKFQSLIQDFQDKLVDQKIKP